MLAESLGLFHDGYDEQTEALRLGAARFLRAGGRPTLAEWCRLSVVERSVLAVEGDKLRARFAVDVADALFSEEGRADVAGEFDDGDAAVDVAVKRFIKKLEAGGMRAP